MAFVSNTRYSFSDFIEGHLAKEGSCHGECSSKTPCAQAVKDFLSKSNGAGFLQGLNFGGLTCKLLIPTNLLFCSSEDGYTECLKKMNELGVSLLLEEKCGDLYFNNNNHEYCLYLKVDEDNSSSYIVGIKIWTIAGTVFRKEIERGKDSKYGYCGFKETDTNEFEHKFAKGLQSMVARLKPRTLAQIVSTTKLPETLSKVANDYLYDEEANIPDKAYELFKRNLITRKTGLARVTA